jgi:hypothetical protein
MRRNLVLIFWSVLFAAFALGAQAQKKAMSFDDYGPERSLLDSLYQNAMNADSTLAVFGDRQPAFMEAWQEFLGKIGSYLHEHGFEWGGPTRCFVRIYFDASGQVDVFLYSFREGAIDPVKRDRFGTLLNELLATHGFPLTAAVPFSQCGPVTFQDVAPK